MLEAVVGVALRAILASVLLGGVLAGLVLIATRALALTAATRHALWTTALLATALMPLAGVGVSVLKGAPPQARVRSTPARSADELRSWVPTTRRNPRPPSVAWGPRSELATTPRTGHDSTALAPAPKSKPQTNTETNLTSGSSESLVAWLRARFAFAGWTPRVTRNLAAGAAGGWVLGALIGLFGLAASIWRVRGLKRRSSPLDGTLADELPWLTAAGAAREIYLRLSYETETPVAIGFGRPVILIPTELATAEGLAAIESLVLHEYAHLVRYDDWTNLVQRAIERIFWFNPVVWLVGRRIALEREIASDDAVVEKTGEPHAYATSLWRLAREMRMPEHAVVAPGALLTRKQITVRIEQLLDKKRARLRRSPATALGVALAAVLAVGFVATSAPAVELPRAESPFAEASAAPAGAREATAWVETKHLATPAGTAAKPPATRRGNVPTTATTVTKAASAKPEHTIVRYEISNAKPVVRDRIVYVHDGQGSKTAPAPSSDEYVPAPPAPPGALSDVPPIPGSSAPAVPPPPLSPKTAASIRAATAAAARAAAETGSYIGPDIARSIREAMASVPRELAQQGSERHKRHAKYDGVKVTREIVASCIGCSFRNSDLRGVDLHGLKIAGDDFSDADMRGANLSGARLAGVSLARAKLGGADLRGTAFAGVDLENTEFDGAQLDDVTMAGVSMQHVALRGAGLRNVMAKCTGCDFSRMDLHGEDLHGIVLNGADLSHADLHGANLSGVRFNGVDLSHTDLSGADLTNARFAGCDLSTTNLRNARTTGLTLQGSTLGE